MYLENQEPTKIALSQACYCSYKINNDFLCKFTRIAAKVPNPRTFNTKILKCGEPNLIVAPPGMGCNY